MTQRFISEEHRSQALDIIHAAHLFLSGISDEELERKCERGGHDYAKISKIKQEINHLFNTETETT